MSLSESLFSGETSIMDVDCFCQFCGVNAWSCGEICWFCNDGVCEDCIEEESIGTRIEKECTRFTFKGSESAMSILLKCHCNVGEIFLRNK